MAIIPPQNLDVITTLTIGPCSIRILGKRSRHGWDIAIDGSYQLKAHRKTKDKALQFAQDACEPGVNVSITLSPTPKP